MNQDELQAMRAMIVAHKRWDTLFGILGILAELERGDIRSQGFDLNGGWVPFYTLHKMYAGLVDVCRYTPNAKALTVLVRFAEETASQEEHP